MEGKDRTGYASSLIEALCGAGYDDLLSDYIKTYEYYYDMTETAKPDQRRARSKPPSIRSWRSCSR